MKARFFLTVRNFTARGLLILAVFIGGVCAAYAADAVLDEIAPEPQVQISYTEEQLQDLISPSVVRVVQHVKGTAQIAPIVIDIKNSTVSLDDTKDPVILDAIDWYISGNGFIVNSDGYILTNAHFISDATSRLAIVTSYIEEAVREAEDMAGESMEEDAAFGVKILDFIIENSTFEFEKEIVVVDPEARIDTDEDVSFEIMRAGLPVSVVYIDDGFYKGGDNLAIIKIKKNDLPAVLISDKNIITVGDKFYAFDTSSVYDIKNASDLDMKGSSVVMDKTDTNVLYTDMDIYPMASGGPSFNSSGEIVGILAFEGQKGGVGNDIVQTLIIPNDIIQTALDKAGVLSNEGLYSTHFKKGVEYINSRYCDEASGEFERALSFGSPFVNNIALDQYLIECYEKIKQPAERQFGIAGLLNMIQEKSATLGFLDWTIIVLVAILVLTLLVVFVVMIGKFRKKGEKTSYKQQKHVRTKEVQNASRMPLSEALPKSSKESPLRQVGIGSDIVVPTDDKTSVRSTIQNDTISSRDKNTSVDRVFPSPELSHTIPSEDQERLAKLWPNKYNNGSHKENNTISPKERKKSEETLEVKTDTDMKLIGYIRNTRALGFGDEDIRQELDRVGWNTKDIDTAFDNLKK